MVPQGGNTGLVGGSVPVHDEVILKFSFNDNKNIYLFSYFCVSSEQLQINLFFC